MYVHLMQNDANDHIRLRLIFLIFLIFCRDYVTITREEYSNYISMTLELNRCKDDLEKQKEKTQRKRDKIKQLQDSIRYYKKANKAIRQTNLDEKVIKIHGNSQNGA